VPGKRSMKARLLPGDGPLAKATPLVAFLAVATVFVVGVVMRGVAGALLLGLLAAAVAVLLGATWRVLTTSQRFGRVLVLAVLVVIAISVL
jgi:energy-coupling factor transporter transmembrane protein EcfT